MNLNPENLNSIKKLEEAGWHGVDISLVASLFKYGIAWKVEDGKIGFIYRISPTEFDNLEFDLPLDFKREFKWMKEKDWNSFLETIGQSFDEWEKFSVGQRIFDLFSCYGYEKIFGSSHWGGFKIEN